MVQRQYPYLDLSVREETRDFLFARQAAFIFSQDFSTLYWANVAGTRLFGFDSIEQLLLQRLTSHHEIASNCKEAAAKIKRNKTYQFELSLPHDKTHKNIIFLIEKIILEDETPAYFIHENKPIDVDDDDGVMEEVVSFLAYEGNFAAVLGFQGKILAASKEFSDLKIGKEQLSNLTYKVAKEDDRLVKKLIAVGRKKLAAGIGTIEKKPYRFLLILVPIEAQKNTVPIKAQKNTAPTEAQKNTASIKEQKNSKPKVNKSKPTSKIAVSKGESDKKSAVSRKRTAPKKALKAELSPITFSEKKQNKLANRLKKNSPTEIVHEGRPVKFTWESDVATRFTMISEKFLDLLHISASDLLNQTWQELADKFGFDEKGEIVALFKGKDMWSGKSVLWPLGKRENTADQQMAVPVDLAALPSFDKDKNFIGFKGFGIIHMENMVPIKQPVEKTAIKPEPVKTDISEKVTESVEAVVSKPNQKPLTKTAKKPAEKEQPKPVTKPVLPATKPVLPVTKPVLKDITNPPKADALNSEEQEAFAEIAKTLSQSVAVKNPNVPQNTTEKNAALVNADVISLHPEKNIKSEEVSGANAPDVPDAPDAGDAAPIVPTPPVQVSVKDLNKELERVKPSLEKASLEKSNAEKASLEKQNQQNLSVVLEQLPVPIIVYRDNDLLFASGDFLKLTEYRSIEEINQRGGLDALFGGDTASENIADNARPKPDHMQLTLKSAERVNVNARLQRVDWEKGSALLMAFTSIEKPINNAPAPAPKNEQPLTTPAAPVKDALGQDDDSQFMTRVSHEIRAPLNTIIGFSDLIMDERFGPLKNDKYREYMRDIRRSGSHMLDIINDYLDLSKIKSGDIHLVDELVNINQLITETVEIVQPQANGDQIIVRTSLSKSVPSIKIDVTTTRQVILNLITNAIKTTPTGGQIIISSLLDASGEVIVRIRDSGNGMDEQMLGYVMEPMKPKEAMELLPKSMNFDDNRFDSQHAGLELSLTKALAEAAGAKFEIFSELKKGTVVELTFPKSQIA